MNGVCDKTRRTREKINMGLLKPLGYSDFVDTIKVNERMILGYAFAVGVCVPWNE